MEGGAEGRERRAVTKFGDGRDEEPDDAIGLQIEEVRRTPRGLI